jgi:hypothetical protein
MTQDELIKELTNYAVDNCYNKEYWNDRIYNWLEIINHIQTKAKQYFEKIINNK